MDFRLILLAIAIVGLIGLVCAVILAMASYFMSVKVDEKYTKIRECLPGANCGACGYTGCDGYAKALADGTATKTNLCVPGADVTSRALSDILGVAFEDVEEKVAYVHCNGTCEAAPKKAEYDGIGTCRSASLAYGGPNSCVYGCLGFGDCANACPENAICLEDGIARIDIRKCIGCGICTRTCPKQIISLIPVTAKTVVQCSSKAKGAQAMKECKNSCIGCKKCELNCECGAVKVVDNLAVIDYSKCNRCGKCAEVCPKKCLKLADFGGSYGAQHAL